ncbi:MAG: PAS domain S-box protein [Bacteroidales bacterium]
MPQKKPYELEKEILALKEELRQLKSGISEESTLKNQIERLPLFKVAENMHDMLLIHDMQGSILYINQAGAMMIGYNEPSAVVGLHVLDLVSHESRHEANKRKAEREKGKRSESRYINHIHKKDGSIVHVESNSTYMELPDGQAAIMIIGHNISKRIVQEELIRKKESEFQNIFKNSPLGIFLYNNGGRIIHYNKEFESITGLKASELHLFPLFKYIKNEQLLNALKYAIDTGSGSFEGYFHPSASKNKLWIKLHLKGINSQSGKTEYVIGMVQDITKSKITEDKLRQNEKYLKRAEQIGKFGNWVFDFKNNTVRSSEGARQIYGLENRRISIDEVQKLPLRRYRKMLDDALTGLIEHGKKYDVEFKIRRASDKQVVDIKSIAEYDKVNKLVFGVIQDITEQNFQKNEIKESEQRFRTLFNENASVMLLIDPENGKIKAANQAALDFYAYSNDEIHKMSIQQINTSSNDKIKGAIEDVKVGKRKLFHFKHRLANGEIRDVEVYSGHIKLKSHTLLYSTIHDITDRVKALRNLRENEERLRLALSASHQGLWDLNLKDYSFTISPEYAGMLGHNPETFSMSMEKWESLLHPEDAAHAQEQFYGYVEGKHKSYQVQFRMQNKDSAYLWILSTGRIIEWDKKGKPARMIGTYTDISKQKAFENELKLAKEKAEENDRLKTAFLQNMSHEIRTPMNGIMGFSELMSEEDSETDEYEKYAEIIHRNSKQLLRIVNDILDISRLDAGQITIEAEQFDLVDLIREIYEFHQQAIHTKGLEFKLVNETNQDEIILKSDPLRIKQIIDNLLSNALKFTNSGYIILGCYAEKNNYIIYVEDSGIGIPKTELRTIFDRFHQTHKALVKSGTGLGLSISRELATLLGGKFMVHSEENKGSRFSLFLPGRK